jgi:hypothetical protein
MESHVLVFHDFVCKIHKKLFGFNEQAVLKSTQRYLANYKLIITAFKFAPWIALLIIE